ncbi:MAG: YwiC-like family protein [Firmicutes bacterium]|nr:YwiC-like family protein [Bacillota bacterium]
MIIHEMSTRRVALPHEHGAWMMWLAPLMAGLAGTPWHPSKPLLAGVVLFAYLASYCVLQAIRHPREGAYWLRWAFGYGLAATAVGAPVLWMRPLLLAVGGVALLGFGVNAWFAHHRNERSLVNDLVAMAGLNLAAVAGYVAGTGRWDAAAWELWGLNLLYFFGTALHVKSVIRERNNRRMKWVAVTYAVGIPVALAAIGQTLLAGAYVPAALRSLAIPQNHRLKAIALGMVEIVCSLWFMVWLIAWMRLTG